MTPADRATRRCQYHCSGCSSCFVSLAAFNAHRGGTYRPLTRCCWPEEAEFRVEIYREDGVCEIGFPTPTLGRTLWRTPAGSTSREMPPSGAEVELDAA